MADERKGHVEVDAAPVGAVAADTVLCMKTSVKHQSVITEQLQQPVLLWLFRETSPDLQRSLISFFGGGDSESLCSDKWMEGWGISVRGQERERERG